MASSRSVVTTLARYVVTSRGSVAALQRAVLPGNTFSPLSALSSGVQSSASPSSSRLRFFSSSLNCTKALLDVDDFTKRFLAEVTDISDATDPALSSKALRSLVRSKVLMFTDMSEAPEKFFLAHRLLSTIGLGGFGIRFTVQFNLFAGSIVGLGGVEQIKMLDSIQEKGQLGCFLLTEMQAGVLSGLIVETTATWDEETQSFILHTPSDKAAKNWISQGYTAELGVVIADLRMGGKSLGPHPFHLRLRDETGKLVPGIRTEDMGIKTVANDLDNARVWFDNVRLPKDALLNRFCDIRDNKYVQVGAEKMRIEVIGQRLLTGRMCIAEAALVSARVLHMKTEAYARKKVCNGLAGERSLYSMPQVQSRFEKSYKAIDEMVGFVAAIEERLCAHLRNGTIPDADLVDAIAVCKIRCIDVAIEASHKLRMEVGSYALMHKTGFELMDMFLCCKFAEGDTRILQMKLARDRLKKLHKNGMLSEMANLFGSTQEARAEGLAALMLAKNLAPAGRDLDKMAIAMDKNWKEVFELAKLIEVRHMKTQKSSTFIEKNIVERLTPASAAFDFGWKGKI